MIVPVKPTDPQSKLLKPAMMRSNFIRGKANPADPNMSAMTRPYPIGGKVKPTAEPTRTRKLYNDRSIVPIKPVDSMSKQHRGTAKPVEKLHPYNFKPTDATRFDPIRGKAKPADPTKELYNHGMIVPVKSAVPRPKMHIDRAKIAYLKHITVPRLQLSTSTSTSTINSADPRLDRKRKYGSITTSPDAHIVKKWI